MGLKYSDGIAAARTMIALHGNANALQGRLPAGWELAPYSGDDLRGSALKGANMLVPFHEVYAVRTQDGQASTGLVQLSYIAFVSQARNLATGELEHIHWFSYTEDPTGIPGKYRDAKLAHITRSQTFTKDFVVRQSSKKRSQLKEITAKLVYRLATSRAAWWSGRLLSSRTCSCAPRTTRASSAGIKKTRCSTLCGAIRS